MKARVADPDKTEKQAIAPDFTAAPAGEKAANKNQAYAHDPPEYQTNRSLVGSAWWHRLSSLTHGTPDQERLR